MADAVQTLTARPPARGRRAAGPRATLKALPWIAPAILLILGVVVFPAALMIFNSTRAISRSGIDQGAAGGDNYAELFAMEALPGVILRTLVWVVVVVALTLVISLAMAQLLDKAFPGRRLVRMIVIIPWAASVVMTTMVVYYGLEPYIGIFNRFFVDIGLLEAPYGWTRNADSAFAWAIVVAVFVSLPFTTYTILAGLQTVPREVLEAARIDGAGRWRTYREVVLPHLRSAIAVAVLINIINVFNNLPILHVMTGSIPGYSADTVMTLIFKLMRVDFGVASALSVVGFALVLAIVAVYLKVVRPLEASR
jgi:multiple sugar transport system permease protein